jgi:ubiquinone biosynthesis protein COQ9
MQRDRIAKAIQTRIKICDPKIHLHNAEYFSKIDKVALGAEIAWNSCSKIWYYAGDQSTDFNYYTKRILCSSVYIPAILYYIKDRSTDRINTSRFIARSVECIVLLGGTLNRLSLKSFQDLPFIRYFNSPNN